MNFTKVFLGSQCLFTSNYVVKEIMLNVARIWHMYFLGVW